MQKQNECISFESTEESLSLPSVKVEFLKALKPLSGSLVKKFEPVSIKSQ